MLEGHFLLTSGRHSNRYLQCAKIFRNTKYSEELCAALAEKYKDDNIQLIIGPAMGAVQMAYEVSRNFDCENFFTERDENGKMQLRRGFAIEPGQRVLVVEDEFKINGHDLTSKALADGIFKKETELWSPQEESCGKRRCNDAF